MKAPDPSRQRTERRLEITAATSSMPAIRGAPIPALLLAGGGGQLGLRREGLMRQVGQPFGALLGVVALLK